MNGWRHPTVVADAPTVDDAGAWTRLGLALLDAVDVGYRAVRVRANHYDPRVDSLLEPIARRGVHTQITLDAGTTVEAMGAATGPTSVISTWLVEAPHDGGTDDVVNAVGDAVERLARRRLRRGIWVSLTKARAHDFESLAAVATENACSHLVTRSELCPSDEPPDELERSMAYVTARRASRGSVLLEVELDLIERDQLARRIGPSLSTAATLTSLVPTLLVSATGQVDPLHTAIAGFSIGNLGDASLLQLLARWRTGAAARWVALQRATITHVGRFDAWPVVDWPAELAACASGGVFPRQGPRIAGAT